MIVVDSEVIAYCWLNTSRTPVAQAVRLKDPDWHVPLLWRFEVRNVLAGYVRGGDLTLRDASRVMQQVEEELSGGEHLVPSDDVLPLAAAVGLSAYDCEFIALAHGLGVPLITENRAVLKAFPKDSVSMDGFLR